MKKTLLSTIVIISIVSYAVGNLAYSFFSVDFDIDTKMDIATIFSGEYIPVFTASSEGNITLDVTTADMLMTDKNTPAATDRGAINIYLEGVNDKDKSKVTCTFDFVYEDLEGDTYTKYAPSPKAKEKNLLEYTIKIVDDKDGIVLAEKSIAEFKTGDTIVSGLSISSDGATVTKDYFVIATIYNLNVEQNITNKKYGFKIKTTNVDCQVTK